ncbi:MAG: hypothetical protein FWD47_05350 [Treponema sp.]|nr:hypothetical protein [Treponema sp.]
MKKRIIYVFIILLCFNNCKNDQRLMEFHNDKYVIYKMKYPKNYREYYKTDEYRNFYLISTFGIRLDSNYRKNLKNIYLYDGINGIEYIIKNINDFENIINNNIPSSITINYYEFCITGSGIENVQNILNDIQDILSKKYIIFEFSGGRPFQFRHSEPQTIIMCTCLGG